MPALSLVVLQAGTASAQETQPSPAFAIEKTLWEAWKNRDPEPFKTHLTDDTINIGGEGITTGKSKVIEEITGSKCEVRSYSLSDAQTHQVNADTVILTYKASQDATCDGEKVPAEVYVSSVYVKQGGKWLAALYHESAAAK
jgi:hypothetical protein